MFHLFYCYLIKAEYDLHIDRIAFKSEAKMQHIKRNCATNVELILNSYFYRNSRRSIKLNGKEEEKGNKLKNISLKYTAARLHEKGVILEIDELQPNQYVLSLKFPAY